MSISIEMEPPLLMSLLLLGVASIFTALGDEVSVKLKQGMVSCDDRDREVLKYMFSIFRCTSISWIHFGESLNQSASDVLDFFLQIMPDIVSDCHHCQYCQQLVVNIGCRLDICQKKIM